jgi:hypothetical protein
MSRRFQIGDRVLFRFWLSAEYRNGHWAGTVSDVDHDSKHLFIIFGSLHDGESRNNGIWRSAWRVRLIETATPALPKHPAVVDARVLEELTAIQQSLGSTEALLDLLRDIRKSYGSDRQAGESG